MDATIIIVLITSITSLIVALFSIVQSTIVSKHNLKSSKSIEELKFNYENRKMNKSRQDEALNKRIDGLNVTIKEIQILKDRLLLLINSQQNSLLADEAYQIIKKSRESLFNCYESYLQDIEWIDAPFIHNAKNLSLHIENNLKLIISRNKYINLSAEQKGVFQEYKNKLNEIQFEIRNIKSNLIFNYTQEHGF